MINKWVDVRVRASNVKLDNKNSVIDFVKRQTGIDLSKVVEPRTARSRTYLGVHIDSEIRQKQRLASLINSTSATVRKKANNAIRSIERLEKQYNEIEKQAKRQRNSPLF